MSTKAASLTTMELCLLTPGEDLSPNGYILRKGSQNSTPLGTGWLTGGLVIGHGLSYLSGANTAQINSDQAEARAAEWPL